MRPEEPGYYDWLRKMLHHPYPVPEKKDMPTAPQDHLHTAVRALYESRIPSPKQVEQSIERRSDHHTDHSHVAWDSAAFDKSWARWVQRNGHEQHRHIHTAIYDEAFRFADKQKESSMNRTEVITAELARLQDELATRSKFGDDAYNEGDVIRFKADFNGDKTYMYAAVKASGKWYLTGRESTAYGWSQLVDFFISTHTTKVWRMAKGERIV